MHKPSGRELVVAGPRTLGQTVYFDGSEAEVAGFESGVETIGPVLARLHLSYRTGPAETDLFVTLYAHVDRVDLDYRVRKRAVAVEERLVHVFPVVAPGATLRLDTTGAVVRPRPAPEGDLLKGGNTRRFAIQGFVDASGPGGGVTVAPQDAFLLRNDLEPLSFEALGNDQNFKEATKDQGGATDFRFAYSLRAHAGDFEGTEAFAWSRSVSMPIVAERGRISRPPAPGPAVDPARAIVLALKPPDDPAARGLVLRLRETAGRSGPLTIEVPRWRRAVRLDLLERERRKTCRSRTGRCGSTCRRTASRPSAWSSVVARYTPQGSSGSSADPRPARRPRPPAGASGGAAGRSAGAGWSRGEPRGARA